MYYCLFELIPCNAFDDFIECHSNEVSVPHFLILVSLSPIIEGNKLKRLLLLFLFFFFFLSESTSKEMTSLFLKETTRGDKKGFFAPVLLIAVCSIGQIAIIVTLD